MTRSISVRKTSCGWCMTRVAVAVMMSLAAQLVTNAAELRLRVEEAQSRGAPLRAAISTEATRIAQWADFSESFVEGPQHPSNDTRPWCFRHGAACGALIGYGAGFVIGVVHPASRDISRLGYAFLFGAPVGAGIGAVVGCCISHEKKVQRQP